MNYKLPSDSFFREDVKFLGENNEEQSQIKKELYEEIQRNDTRLRNKYKQK